MMFLTSMLSAWLMLVIGLIFRFTEQYHIADTFHAGGLVIMFLLLGIVLDEHNRFLKKHNEFLKKLNADLKRNNDANQGK